MNIENFNDIHSTNEIGLHEQKLNGELPVTREELKELIKSWGKINYSKGIIENRRMCYDLSKLDVSQITNMNNLFKRSPFEGDISNWDVSNVTSMESMFESAKYFNSPLNNWNTSKVTNMGEMFYEAKIFNQDISKWDVSNVTSMSYMFHVAEMFNQPLNSWDVSNVKDMSDMFAKTLEFNQNISNWNLENIEDLNEIFEEAKAFVKKYNRDKPLPEDTKENHGKDIEDFFSNITDIYSTNRIGLHENLLTECNKLCL